MGKVGRRAGFTLIEIMIVVAIVSILAAVAVPNYVRYQLRVKAAESRVLLGSIITAQEAFLAEFEQYAEIAAIPAGISSGEKRPWPIVACPSACSRTNTADCNSFECLGFNPETVVYYSYGTSRVVATSGQTAEFGVGAAADLDADSTVGSFGYRTGNGGSDVGVVGDPVSMCAVDLPVDTIHDCMPTTF